MITPAITTKTKQKVKKKNLTLLTNGSWSYDRLARQFSKQAYAIMLIVWPRKSEFPKTVINVFAYILNMTLKVAP